MILPYKTILNELKSGPKTLPELQAVDKEGDTAESLICLVARGLVQTLDNQTFTLNREAMDREKNA